MNTIVVNTRNGAVSEYSGFTFDSITPTHAGSALGLFALGGGRDIEQPIVATVTTPRALIGATKMTSLETVFIAARGTGSAALTIYGQDVSYTYPFDLLEKGVSRVRPGRGFRQNYAAFGFSNPTGDDFELDRIEIPSIPSPNRRTE